MFGIIDISHRYKKLDANHLASVLSVKNETERTRAKAAQTAFTKLLFKHFARQGFNSIEEYGRAAIDSYTAISKEAAWDEGLRELEFLRVFDTFYCWRSRDDNTNIAQVVAEFIDKRNLMFGDVFLNLGSSFRDVDEENTDLTDFVSVVADTFAVDDVILWKYNPTNKYLVELASTVPKRMNADIHRGLIAEAVESRRSVYYPNIRSQSNYLELVQHRDAVSERQWKGVLVCPLHFSKNLVGVIGLYSRHDLIFSKVELGLLLYMFANLSKRVSREVFGSTGEAENSNDMSPEKLMRLAPTIYVGTKTTYRLHSIKNKVRTLGEVLKEIKPHVPKKKQGGVNWREKVTSVQSEAKEIFEELESCLLIGSNKSRRLFKLVSVHIFAEKIQRMIVNHVSATDIIRRVTITYNKDARLQADLISLEQAIYNVIENAFFFLSNDIITRRKPELHVEIVQDGSILEICVKDNANGMTEEDKDNYRVLYYSGKRKTGSGVGLWMTDRIVNDHFGDFDISSSDHNGTVCRIDLPIEEVGDKKRRVSRSGILSIE